MGSGGVGGLRTLVRTAKERMTLYNEELLRFLTGKQLLRGHLQASDEELDLLATHQQTLPREGGSERTGVTIVGDLNQKIIPEADFIGWDALAEQLGLSGAEVAKLEVAHRSTRPIVELASSVSGDGEASGRPGPKPTMVLVGDHDGLAREIARIAQSAIVDRQGAHVCVVCRSPSDAVAMKSDLAVAMAEAGGDESAVRLGHNADFTFGPGITVTNVRQIKGLEFDVVIVVEPDEVAYPVDEQGRRWLYTVLTRAKDRLWLVASRPVTPLLDEARARMLVEVEDLTEVVPVQLGVGDDEPF